MRRGTSLHSVNARGGKWCARSAFAATYLRSDLIFPSRRYIWQKHIGQGRTDARCVSCIPALLGLGVQQRRAQLREDTSQEEQIEFQHASCFVLWQTLD